MVQTPRPGALAVAVMVAFVAVSLGTYLEPDARTPLTVQAGLWFFATLVVLHRFRVFRRPQESQ